MLVVHLRDSKRNVYKFLSKNHTDNSLDCLTQFLFFFGSTATTSVSSWWSWPMTICSHMQPFALFSSHVMRLCIQSIGVSYFIGFLHSAIHVGLLFRLTFCRTNVIHYFYCEILQLFKISCTDSTLNTLLVFIFQLYLSLHFYDHHGLLHLYPVYHSEKEVWKGQGAKPSPHAVPPSICFLVLWHSLLHVCASWVLVPLNHNKIYSLFYTIIIPLLNPFICQPEKQRGYKCFEKNNEEEMNSC